MKFFKYVIIFSLILAFIYTTIIYPSLPNEIPIHWNIQGEADSFAAKEYIFLLLGVVVLIYLSFPWLKKIDPKKDNYDKFKAEYQIIRYVITIVLLAVYLISIQVALGSINSDNLIPIIIGFLLMVLGNYMSRIRQSYFIGIKTPWTLASETVWRKTHRLGGYIFVFDGLLLILLGLINNSVFSIITGVIINLGIVYLFYYSYKLYKIEKNK